MPTISTLVVAVKADIKGLQTGLAQAQGQTAKTAGAMSSFGAVGSLAMTTAAVAAVKFGVDSVKAFAEAQQVMAQTEAVLKSTGGQAGVTSEDVLALATKWQNLSGVQDDAIQSSENLLLTFRDVHNELGAGNDIFNQATGAILDMSTALNRGAIPSADQLQSSTIQLGKALNDPIAGMTALKRVGVSFNESQVATIKRLQESGDLMGAQKIILGELKAEFGGAAKAAGDTFAGSLAKLQANINNLQEKIGGVLVPRLLLFASILNDIAQGKFPDVTDAINLAADAASHLPGPLGIAGDAFEQLKEGSNELAMSKDDINIWAGSIREGTLTVDALRRKFEEAGFSAESTNTVLGAVRQALIGLAKDAAAAAEKAGAAMSGFAGLTRKEFKAFRGTIAESVQSAVDDLSGFSNKWELTAREAITRMTNMADKARTIAKDFKALDTEAVPDKFKSWLLQQGPDAVHAFAEASDAGKKKMVSAWRDIQDNIQKSVNTLRNLTRDAGAALGEGFAQGILAREPVVRAAVKHLAQTALDQMRQTLGVGSPSTITRAMGEDVVQGLIDGLKAREKDVQKVFDSLSNKLQNLTSRASDFRSAISGGFGSLLDLSNIPEGGDIASFISESAASARQWGAVLNALQRQGLSGPLLSQIASMGPQALGMAQQLLQLGPQQIAAINQQYQAILKVQDHVSKSLTEKYFGDKIDQLREVLGDVRETLHHIAKRLDDLSGHASGGIATRPTLGIFGEHGPEALVPLGAGEGMGGITGPIVIQLDGKQLAVITRDELLKLGARNGTTGL